MTATPARDARAPGAQLSSLTVPEFRLMTPPAYPDFQKTLQNPPGIKAHTKQEFLVSLERLQGTRLTGPKYQIVRTIVIQTCHLISTLLLMHKPHVG